MKKMMLHSVTRYAGPLKSNVRRCLCHATPVRQCAHSRPPKGSGSPHVDVDDAVASFALLINKRRPPSQFELGRISYVQDLLDEMHASGQRPDILTYNILLDGLCKSQHLDEAIDLFKKVVGKGICLDRVTYTILIDGLCKGGRLKTGHEIFQHLLIKGYQLNVKTYSAMINGLCKEGLFDDAIELLSKMNDNGCSPNDITASTIIQALLDKNETEKAEKILREMISRGLFK